jgi:hypothetical protein
MVLEMSEQMGVIEFDSPTRLPGRFHLQVECLEVELFCQIVVFCTYRYTFRILKVRSSTTSAPREVCIARRIDDLWEDTPDPDLENSVAEHETPAQNGEPPPQVRGRGRIIPAAPANRPAHSLGHHLSKSPYGAIKVFRSR